MAEDYLLRAKLLFLDIEDFGGAVSVLIEQSGYFLETSKTTKAQKAIEQAAELIRKYDIKSQEPKLNTRLSEYYQKIGKFKESIKLSESIVSGYKHNNNEEYQKNLELLHKSYSSINEHGNAYKYLTIFHNYIDSINNSNLHYKVEALKTEFQVNQKESENELLRAEQKTIQKAIYSKNVTAIALSLAALLVLSWALYLYLNNKKTKSHQKILELQVKERTNALYQANNQLVQANNELQSFNHIASHDIKEPIRVIGNHLGLIQRKLPANSKPILDPLFSTIRASTSQLYNVIENFSRYRKFASQSDIQIEKVNIFDLLKNISFIYHANENAKIYLSENIPTYLHTNQSMIYIIFKKLIDNGLKFNTSTTPTINISSAITGDEFQISFSDNGIGIDSAYHEKIFEPYQRLGKREDFEGTGFGLAIVKLLVTKLQGRIELDSSAGNGSTFTIYLPTNTLASNLQPQLKSVTQT